MIEKRHDAQLSASDSKPFDLTRRPERLWILLEAFASVLGTALAGQMRGLSYLRAYRDS